MNNRTIGFDRELSLNWLDLTAGLILSQREAFAEGYSENATIDGPQIRQVLLGRLAGEIPGEKACRNTITVLTRIWIRVPEAHRALQDEALALLPRVLPEERLWLHWGMCLLAYPFFRDVAAIIGRLLALQGRFDSAQVLRRMRESWGQRTTLDRAVPRALQTLVAWGVNRELPAVRHVYEATPPRSTTNTALALWFMECVLRSILGANLHNDGQLPLAELIQSPTAFPFELAAHRVALRRSNRFEVSRQGLDLEMVTPRTG
jgi:hypothetical protein